MATFDAEEPHAEPHAKVTISEYIVPRVMDFPRHNMKWSRENEKLCGICHVASRFPLHFIKYRGNFGYFLDSVGSNQKIFCNITFKTFSRFRHSR